VGDCGESQAMSGSKYFKNGGGIQDVDYNSAFFDPTGGPFHRTYAHLHFSPPNKYNLPELFNVTDLVRLLLRPPPRFPREPNAMEDASFSHNNCGSIRGRFVNNVIAKSNMTIARYGKCWHNKDTEINNRSCAEQKQEELYHKDCEAHRDSTKTVMASWHKFTFALENTWSRDYFTEKRYQALWGGSVPIVWNNDNSKAYLPDPDAALLVEKSENPIEFGNKAHALTQEEGDEAFFERFFAWKKRGLRPDFVRKLFLSTDFLMCRICEHVAHHHFYDEEDE
jgi:hypothetical protein